MTISAKIVADSISDAGVRLTTMQLRYPRMAVHEELLTHRQFSRNSSSSRAIPVQKLIQDVINDPVYPIHWGKNQSGMQAKEECNNGISGFNLDVIENEYIPISREKAWDIARDNAIKVAKEFDAAGYHKQIVNRLLEPFAHINVVVTSTEWSNFFALRRHKDAQPEIKELADKMFEAYSWSHPWKCGDGLWHLPYIQSDDYSKSLKIEDLIKISVARCARVSYLTHEGKEPDIESDLKLYDRLVGSQPIHASPAEHQATPDKQIELEEGSPLKIALWDWENPDLHGNFNGWIQYRKTLDNECL